MFLAPKPMGKSEIPAHRRQLSIDESAPVKTTLAVNQVSEPVFDQSGSQLFGLDAELELKRRDKHDPEHDRKALLWLSEVTGEKVDPDDVWESLKSGVILCKLANKIVPNTIKPDSRSIPLVERENIAKYLAFCGQWGVESNSLFVISDLYEKKGLEQVITNVYTMAKIYERMSGFKGPTLESKPAGGSRSMIIRTTHASDSTASKDTLSPTMTPRTTSDTKTSPSREAFASRLMDKFFKEPEEGAGSLSAASKSVPVLPAKPSSLGSTTSIIVTKAETEKAATTTSEREELQKKKEEMLEKLKAQQDKKERKKIALERKNSLSSSNGEGKKKEDEEDEEEEEEDSSSSSESEDEEEEKPSRKKRNGSGKGKLAFVANFLKLQHEQLQQQQREFQEKLNSATQQQPQQLQQQRGETDSFMVTQGLVFLLLFVVIRLLDSIALFLPLSNEVQLAAKEALAPLSNDTLFIGVILMALGQLIAPTLLSNEKDNSKMKQLLWKILSRAFLVLAYGVGLLGRLILNPALNNIFVLAFWGIAFLVVLVGFSSFLFQQKQKTTTTPK